METITPEQEQARIKGEQQALRKRVTIFSIYPEDLPTETCARAQPVGEYKMPAGSMEKPTIVVVEDAREKVYAGEDSQGLRMYEFKPILAMVTARDLVNRWRDLIPNSTIDSCIGVAISEGDVPTKEELATANVRQVRFFDKLVREARQLHADGHTHLIRSKHRMAATNLKLNRANDPWIHETMVIGEQTNCPLCKSTIPAEAIICPICTRQLKAMPEAFQKFAGNRSAA